MLTARPSKLSVQHLASRPRRLWQRRRLPLALTDAALGLRVARPVAERLVRAWGRPASAVDEEIERYRELMHRETGRSLGQC